MREQMTYIRNGRHVLQIVVSILEGMSMIGRHAKLVECAEEDTVSRLTGAEERSR